MRNPALPACAGWQGLQASFMVRRSISSRCGEPAGVLRGLHLLVGAARPEERIHPALRQALVGLAHRLDHGGEGGAGGRRQPVAEPGEIALRQREGAEAVGRREHHQRRRQPLAHDAQLVGAAGIAEQHVGAGLVKGLGPAHRLVEAADAPRIGAGDDDEVGIGARIARRRDLLRA